jgi:phage terminase Nu1 subunit (DNA packaging protein)
VGESAKPRTIASHQELDGVVSGETLQKILGVSHETVRRLARDGHLEKIGRGRYDLLPSLQKYIEHLREVASGRGGEDEQAELAREKMLLTREQREGQELKNQILRGELVEASKVTLEWARVMASIRSIWLSIPARIRTALPHLRTHEVDSIDRVVRDLLTDMADDTLSSGSNKTARPRKAQATAKKASK